MANPETFVDRARRVVKAIASGQPGASHVVRIEAALRTCQALVSSDRDTDGVVRLGAGSSLSLRSLLSPTYARCSRAGLVVPEAWLDSAPGRTSDAEKAFSTYVRGKGHWVGFDPVARLWTIDLHSHG